MKRFSLFLISTLTLFANLGELLVKPAAAIIDHSPAKGYWTIEEMEAFAVEVEPELAEACPSGSFPGCKGQYLFEKGQNDKIYWALQYYQGRRTLVEAFNPSNNTIRVNVRSVSPTNTEYGIMTHEDVVDLYVIRTDKNYVAGSIPRSVSEGDPKVHTAYAGLQSKNGDEAGWFPMDTSVTLRADDLTMDNDYYTCFIVHAHMGTYGDVTHWHYGGIDPYVDGMEYRLVFTETSHKYILAEAVDMPVFGETITTEPDPSTQPSREPDSPISPTSDPDPDTDPGSVTDPVTDTPTVEPSTDPAAEGPAVESTSNPSLAPEPTTESSYDTILPVSITKPESTAPADQTQEIARAIVSAKNIASAGLAVPVVAEQGNTEKSESAPVATEPATPLGGNVVASSSASRSENQFPWWIIVLALVGVSGVIFWLAPVRKTRK